MKLSEPPFNPLRKSAAAQQAKKDSAANISAVPVVNAATPRLAWGLESDSLPNSGSGEKSRDRRTEQRFLLWFAGRSSPRQPPR
jgi:hypothetical protein